MITLDDFPGEILVYLDETYRAKMFKFAWKLSGGYRKLAKEFGVSKVTMLGWRTGKHCDGKTLRFCPVWVLRKLSQILDSDKFNFDEIQKHVTAYKIRKGLIINNPNVPITDCTELREFVIHLMCDGTAQNIKFRTCHYTSTCYAAVDEFKNLIKIFGEIDREITSQKKSRPAKDAYRVSFPKSIAKILIKKFGSMDGKEARIPKEFFNGDRRLRSAVIRAFLIDEGSIRDTRVFFTSGNRLLLEDLQKICEILNYKCGKLRKTQTAYELSICSQSFRQLYKDMMNIAPLPIDYKQKRLEFGVELLNNISKDSSSIKTNILELLSLKPMTNMELAHKLSFRARTIWPRLKELEKENKIRSKKTAGMHGAYIYELSFDLPQSSLDLHL